MGLVVFIGGACGLESVTDEEAVEILFVDRPDYEPGDIERQVGESSEIYGREVTLIGFEYVDQFNEIDNDGYVVLEVTVKNTSSEEFERNRGDWTLELPDGRRAQTAPVEGQPQMRTGELEAGEETTAKLVFSVGEQRGDFFAVFLPRALRNITEDRERVVWALSVE